MLKFVIALIQRQLGSRWGPFRGLLPIALCPGECALSIVVGGAPASAGSSLPGGRVGSLPQLTDTILPLYSRRPNRYNLFPLRGDLSTFTTQCHLTRVTRRALSIRCCV